MNKKYLIAVKTATGKSKIYEFPSEKKRNIFVGVLKDMGVNEYALSEVRA